MNKSETNEGGEDSNNNEEVLVVVVSKMKVAQKLVGRRRRTHKFIFFGRMQHFSFSCVESRWTPLLVHTCLCFLLNMFNNSSLQNLIEKIVAEQMQSFWKINSTHKWRSTTKSNKNCNNILSDSYSNLNVFWTSYNLYHFMLTLIQHFNAKRIIIWIQFVVSWITLF